MEVPSAQIRTTKISEVTYFLAEVFDSPKKATIFVLFVSLLLSLTLFGFFLIKQDLAAKSVAKEQSETVAREKIKQAKQKQSAQEASLNLQDQQRKQDLEQLKFQLEKFYQSKSYYPSSLNNLTPSYFTTIPKDPETNYEYYFLCGLDQKSYTLRTVLSDGSEYELVND